MGKLFFWMNKPDPGIPDISWVGFLDGMAALTLVVVLITVTLTLVLYSLTAYRRKIYSLVDLFAPYTPLWWIVLALPAGLVAGVVCWWQYPVALGSSEGLMGIALQVAILNILTSALISYVAIVLIPGLTPAKLRYRPAPYLHRNKLSGAHRT